MQYNRLIGCFCTGLLCLVSTVGLCAQQDTVSMRHRDLNGVEVVEKARPVVNREGAPIQVMNRDEMLRLGMQELSEVVRRFSGVTVKDYGGIGGLKTVSVRSLGAQHTAVSYDGITISDAQSGQVDISRYSLDNVEQVVLSIGQTDNIFQTARMYASAGALQIETSHPQFADKNYTLEGQFKAGSFGYFNPSFRYGQKVGSKVAVTMHGDWLTADGDYPFTLVNGTLREEQKRLNSDINSWRGEANLYADLQHAGRLQVKAYYFDS
ncbi:MAG: TonB-dependent receptor plug domain-containing protein, partial [Porphyromonadaceae bacterium]|nr:TonB-dependent receptor plug domain-containing protein [Porphyromonadaceae bacterium]